MVLDGEYIIRMCGTVKYNKEQKEAIRSINGPVMVISCAGSGKTTVILERTNRIIQSGIPSENILVVTFSKMAATQMQERFLEKYQNHSVKFATIHSICYSVLVKAYSLRVESILSASEKRAFFQEQYAKIRNTNDSDFKQRYQDVDDFYKDIELKISGFMSLMYKKEANYEDIITDKEERGIFCSYVEFKETSGKLDFDDMIIKCHEYLKGNEEARDYWSNIFQYIMIDEYQDTTILQAEIFFMLAKEQNICVVGDDDQSIYSFRDADSKIFQRFLEEYPKARQIFLETNYRSQPQIITLGANLIRHNKERFLKTFRTFKNGNAKIVNFAVEDSMEQAKKIVEFIRAYEKRNISLYNIAILYRVKNEASIICNQLVSEKIPFYTKEPPGDIHKNMVYQDIKAYYRLANDLWGRTDLRRIINRPKRYIKAEAVSNCGLNKQEIINRCIKNILDGEQKERINKIINQLFLDLNNLKGKTPKEFMQYLLTNMQYRDCLIEYANFLKVDSRTFTNEFDALMEEAKKFQTMLEWDNYVEEYEKELITSMEENKKKGVYLSTFHSAKGLEWDNVIIISANEGITPLKRRDVIENPEEERRLFYVAITRAKEELFILHFKEKNGVATSRYISELYDKVIT